MRSIITFVSGLLLLTGLCFAAVSLGDWETKSPGEIDATGGPDTYGYTWIDSNEPGGPTYNWIDITTTGTLVTGIGDDNWVGPFPTGFPFHYYWYDVVQFYIGSNGYLKFGTPYNMAQPFPASIPLTAAPNDFVGVYIADWYPGQAGQGSVYRWSNNVDSVIVSFIDIPEWTTTPASAGSHDFQVILTDTDSSITFQYGAQTGTVSNNDLLVGIENNNGQVGLEHSHDTYISSNYVVRYVYPPNSTYIVHDMAVTASANDNSEGFFLLNGDTITPWAKVKNSGNQVESTFQVSCLIESETGTPYYYQTTTLGPLNPGAELAVPFPVTWTPTTNQQYFYTCTVTLTGDMNPNNDVKTTELRVLDLPGTLLYDDGTSEQAWTWMGGTGGLAQRFVPPDYPVNVNSIKFYIASSSSTLPFTAKVFDDDGADGTPGTELFSQNVNATVANQWYTVSTPGLVINDGSYYVSWHMTGENSPGIGVDQTTTQIGSRQSWEYTGVWAAYRDAEESDVMIRCDISSAGAAPDLDVTLTYVSGSPVPPQGGNIYFAVYVINNESTSLDFDAWLDISYEGGAPNTVLQRYLTGFMPGWVINRPDSWYPVPATAPAGNYTFTGRVGDHPSTIWDESGFPFVKSSTGDDITGEFVVTDGFPDPFEIITKTEVELPVEAFMIEAYPNPFNPVTTIHYDLVKAGTTHLKVYDINGRVVATLVDGYRSAGRHTLEFDASHLASGLYLYRLESGGQTAGGKMLLLK